MSVENTQSVERLRRLIQDMIRSDEVRRKRVARTLHDDILQLMFLFKPVTEEQIPLVDTIVDVLQRLIRDHLPPLLEHQGLVSAIDDLLLQSREVTDSPTIRFHSNTTDASLNRALSAEEATALYRITQEALTNALKHADARTIMVRLIATQDDRLNLQIKDDGVGLPASIRASLQAGNGSERHYGLDGMQERATMIGAEMSIASISGEGTTVEVCLKPCRELLKIILEE
jgi:signal transduction histidine kinase